MARRIVVKRGWDELGGPYREVLFDLSFTAVLLHESAYTAQGETIIGVQKDKRRFDSIVEREGRDRSRSMRGRGGIELVERREGSESTG